MVIRKLVEAGIRASRLDKQAWDKMYFGIRSDIKLGITLVGMPGFVVSPTHFQIVNYLTIKLWYF